MLECMKQRLNLTLRATRVLRGLNQAELGSRVGRSQSWVCQIERGQIRPNDVDVALLCRVLQVNPDSVFPDDSTRNERAGLGMEPSQTTPEGRVRVPP